MYTNKKIFNTLLLNTEVKNGNFLFYNITFHHVCSQLSMLSSPEVSFDPSEEVIQVGLKELRRTAASLKGELTQLKALVTEN